MKVKGKELKVNNGYVIRYINPVDVSLVNVVHGWIEEINGNQIKLTSTAMKQMKKMFPRKDDFYLIDVKSIMSIKEDWMFSNYNQK